jgi:hypothetical protein
VSADEIEALLASCNGDWGCVRTQLRARPSTDDAAAQDDATAARIAGQFGVGVDQVWSIYNSACAGDWSCVRKTLRGDSHHGKH